VEAAQKHIAVPNLDLAGPAGNDHRRDRDQRARPHAWAHRPPRRFAGPEAAGAET